MQVLQQGAATLKDAALIGSALVLLLASGAFANSHWPKPALPPLPDSVQGVARPKILLNGAWKADTRKADDPLTAAAWPSWRPYTVPGELLLQGFDVKQNSENTVARRISIPADFAGKRILLRFEAVHAMSRVFVNGKLVRSHVGGFTPFDCEITSLVVPGDSATVILGVNERGGQSGYAHHPVAGITRDAWLYALPKTHIRSFHYQTLLERPALAKATLRLQVELGEGAEECEMALSLSDPEGNRINLATPVLRFPAGSPGDTVDFPIEAPKLWDAEHPRLYTLTAVLKSKGVNLQTISRKVGFREVRTEGAKLLVNGREVKLRGGNRHDVHPLLGRAGTREQDSLDVRLLRAANINFVRTSHYPQRSTFLEFCDRYGLYVLEEAPVCFAGGSVGHADNAKDFLDPFAAMIEKDRSHPSIILWSMANESGWGSNLTLQVKYVREEDPTRPLTVGRDNPGDPKFGGEPKLDLWSCHYCRDGEPGRTDVPLLHSEMAHVACYNKDNLRYNPGVRDAWGPSISRFWAAFRTRPGTAGAAIWGLYDDVFHHADAPGSTSGYGQWGILDGYRRPKPEYWNTLKAFSPVVLDDSALASAAGKSNPSLRIRNFFDHSRLSEVKAVMARLGPEGFFLPSLAPLPVAAQTLSLPDIGPRDSGNMVLPLSNLRTGEVVNLRFFGTDGILLDEYNLRVGPPAPPRAFPAPGKAPALTQDAGSVTVTGKGFTLLFDKATGSLRRGNWGGETVITGGPYLNLGLLPVHRYPFTLESFSAAVEGDSAVIRIQGRQALRDTTRLRVQFTVVVDDAGLLRVRYAIPEGRLPATEVGISFALSRAVDRLTWERQGLWTSYPADHIARLSGTALRWRRSAGAENSRTPPAWSWGLDMKDYFLAKDTSLGATNDFRSRKENVYWASMATPSFAAVRLEGTGQEAVRGEALNDTAALFALSQDWGNDGLGWGNWERTFSARTPYQREFRLRLLRDTVTGPATRLRAESGGPSRKMFRAARRGSNLLVTLHEAGDYRIEAYSLQGRLLASWKAAGDGERSFALPSRAGAFFLRVRDAEGRALISETGSRIHPSP